MGNNKNLKTLEYYNKMMLSPKLPTLPKLPELPKLPTGLYLSGFDKFIGEVEEFCKSQADRPKEEIGIALKPKTQEENQLIGPKPGVSNKGEIMTTVTELKPIKIKGSGGHWVMRYTFVLVLGMFIGTMLDNTKVQNAAVQAKAGIVWAWDGASTYFRGVNSVGSVRSPNCNCVNCKCNPCICPPGPTKVLPLQKGK